jgi:putative DNA primase/helicase
MISTTDPVDLADMSTEQMQEIARINNLKVPPGSFSAVGGATEESLAREWIANHGLDWRYDYSYNSWFYWNGNCWKPDKTLLAQHLIGEHLRKADGNVGRRWLGSNKFVLGVENFARRNPAVAVNHDNWDKDTMLLGTTGGVIDLNSGMLRMSKREDYITKSASVAPETGDPELWFQFLNEIFDGDQEILAFVQRLCGYCLTGETKEHSMVFLYGEGGNGKSVFLNTISGILGDYSKVAAMETFTGSQYGRHSTELATLCGARLVTASETEQGRGWDEAKLKSLTGGDPITARFMRQDFFTYLPQFKLLIAGNYAPSFRQVDEAIRRRMKIIPFTTKPQKPDRDLERKLKQEWPKILNWMIEGVLQWQTNGLHPPESVRETTEQYFTDQDVFAQWIADCCILDRSAREESTPLFASWKDYAKNAGVNPGTQSDLKTNLERKGVTSHRTSKSRGFYGISLIQGDNGDG